MTDFGSFLLAATRVTSPASCPELRLHLAEDLEQAWREMERWLGRTGLPPPYWAVAWPGGQAIARHAFDEPARLGGKRVLDLGSGCGLCAIAAVKAGAAAVEAADTDPYARAASAANAALNGVRLATVADDLIGSPPRWDTVLAGDLWYERFLAQRATAWLRDVAAAGVEVLVGDSGRAFFPRTGLTHLGTYAVDAPESLEPTRRARAGVWRIAA